MLFMLSKARIRRSEHGQLVVHFFPAWKWPWHVTHTQSLSWRYRPQLQMLPFVDVASFQIIVGFCMFSTGLALMHLQADMCLP